MIAFRAVCLGLFCWGISAWLLPTAIAYRLFLGLGALTFLFAWIGLWFWLMVAINDD